MHHPLEEKKIVSEVKAFYPFESENGTQHNFFFFQYCCDAREYNEALYKKKKKKKKKPKETVDSIRRKIL